MSPKQTGMVPMIAIVGNVTALPGDAEQLMAEQAGKDLGRQLAAAGYHIVVYSSERQFLEAHVVSGYVASGHAQLNSIHVMYPEEASKIAFPEWTPDSQFFFPERDPSSDWEISFYDSLAKVQGILLLGGGRSTLIAGLVGAGYGLAVIPIPTFGGYAKKIWSNLHLRQSILRQADLNRIAKQDWTEQVARDAVALFATHAERVAELKRVQQVEMDRAAEETKRYAWAAVLLFSVAATVALSVTIWSFHVSALAISVVIGAVFAGVSGATIRALADLFEGRATEYARQAHLRLALGVVAGLFMALVIAVPQIANESHLPPRLASQITEPEKQQMKAEQLSKSIPTALLAAFVTAFAIDQFYRKLRELRIKEPELLGK